MQLRNRMSSSQSVLFATKLLLIGLVLWSNLAATSTANPIDTSEQNKKEQHELEKLDGQRASESQAESGTEEGSHWSLIDWNLYKEKFNKNYSSLTQQLLRQKIFMSKQIQVFFVSTKWRLQKNGYFTSINQFSDLTPEEEHEKLSGDGGEYASDDEDDDDIMDDEQARRALMEALEESEQAVGESESATNLAAKKSLERHKRSLMNDLIERNLDFNDLVRVPSSTRTDPEAKLNIKWVVPSNNPDYQPVEAHSFGAETSSDAPEKVQDIPLADESEVEMTSDIWLALPKLIGDKARNTFNWLKSGSFRRRAEKGEQANDSLLASKPTATRTKVNPPTNDQVIVDWRRSGCVAPPIDQRECQSCYAVSSMSFLEWALCMNQDKTLTPLSVQYFISCGPQYKQESDPALKIQFYGCARGRSRQAMYFVKEYGVELAAHMPYLARNTECPIEKNTPLKHKGYIRPNVKQHVRMAATTTQLDLALKVGPVIVNFREPLDFLAYGGGMVGRCYQRGGHAMLVVGHGIEDDKPYLLIKNSFGTNWGMKGYFKFDRKYTEECVKDFILPRVSFPSKKAQARRVKAYLAEHQAPGTADLEQFFDVGAGGLFS